MSREIAAPRPEGTIRLDEFCGTTCQIWIDGRPLELNRIELFFPNRTEKISAVERLAHASLETREDALQFLLNVLEHFSRKPKVAKAEVAPETSVA